MLSFPSLFSLPHPPPSIPQTTTTTTTTTTAVVVLTNDFDVDPKECATQWAAFAFNSRPKYAEITAEGLVKFRAHLKNLRQRGKLPRRKVRRAAAVQQATPRSVQYNKNNIHMAVSGTPSSARKRKPNAGSLTTPGAYVTPVKQRRPFLTPGSGSPDNGTTADLFSPGTGSPSTSYSERKNRGATSSVFNSNIPRASAKTGGTSTFDERMADADDNDDDLFQDRVQLSMVHPWRGSPKDNPDVMDAASGISKFRFMFEEEQDIADELSQRLEQYMDTVMGQLQRMAELKKSSDTKMAATAAATSDDKDEAQNAEEQDAEDEFEFGSLCVPSQQEVYVAGRIVNEDPTQANIANASLCMIEGDRNISGSVRVKLSLPATTPHSLFHGKMVALRGVNSSGHAIIAKEFLRDVAPPRINATVGRLQDANDRMQGRPLHIMTAAGPFTTSDNLDYRPLDDLLEVVLQDKPDVLFLFGPFVDADHFHVKEQMNMGGRSHGQLFKDVMQRIRMKLQHLSQTSVCIVPSSRDVTHVNVFPQPAFAPMSRLTMLPNPCIVDVNGVTIALSSHDTLFSLAQAERSGNMRGNRLVRLAGQIIGQHSFYPIFPPNEDDNVDCSHLEKFALSVSPDVLIMPSRLKSFAQRITDNVMFVNPGYLTKNTFGGTYASVSVHPIKEKVAQKHVHQRVSMRSRVDIMNV
jgi:DNA polymerase alpha/epsilon subunit B/DNA polymerase alpha subunit B, OB domain